MIDAFVHGMLVGVSIIGAISVLILAVLAALVIVGVVNGIVDGIKGD